MKNWIRAFRDLISDNCLKGDNTPKGSVEYSQNLFFISLMEVVIPLSLITFIPGVIYSLVIDLPLLVFLNSVSFGLVIYIGVGRGLSLETRKFLLLLSAYMAAGYLLFYVGFKGPGFLYLYTACVFGILVLPMKYAFLWSWLNTLVCALFTIVLMFNLSPLAEVNDMTVAEWLAISVNLLFLSFLTSAILPKFFVNLSNSFQKQAELQASLVDKQKSLEKALQDIEHKNKELEHFAHAASHDLQEPLRTISSFISLLEKKYGSSLDEKAHEYIRFTVDGAQRMRKIIMDLLEFSKAGAYSDPVQPIALSDIIKEVKVMHRELISEKSATIEYQNLPTITFYKSPLLQIFQNLLSNALKYSKKDVPAAITIGCQSKNGQWVFNVTDNGIGIEKESFEKIFIIFKRLHGRGEYEGTGIGLALVKKIVESFGGRIWVESEPDKGSTFYFTIEQM